MAVLKIQRFYDFVYKASILIKSDGIIGLVFRCEDIANYYVLEIKNL